jgi:hypothetical protein
MTNFRRRLCRLLLVLCTALLPRSLPAAPDGPPQPKPPAKSTPEARALAYLADEVPGWSREHDCFSCHNNGDGARALYAAVRLGRTVPPQALEKTSRWLGNPDGWDKSGAGMFANKPLTRIQFGSALVEAFDAGLVKDRKALTRAAELVAQLQQKDGSWQVDTEGTVGSPVTYGPALATYLAGRLLQRAGADKHGEAVARAADYLRRRPVKTVPDAAAQLLALEGVAGTDAADRRKECLALLAGAQTKEGGWGPYVKSAPEAYDTALVLLALSRSGDAGELKTMRQRGRAFLVATQERDGSWPETTRPAGATSYPQRLSTAGWATLALLATAKDDQPGGKP